MKIGIDASGLAELRRTGTENYLYFLIKGLVEVDSKNEYVLFFEKKPSEKFIKNLLGNKTNFSYKVLEEIFSWTQISLALELFRNDYDVLVTPWHTIPGIRPLSKTKIVSVIHDLTGRKLPTNWTIRHSHKLVAVSDYVREQIESNFTRKDASKNNIKNKITVIYEGVSSNLYKADSEEIAEVKRKYGIKGDYIFFLGTIGLRKNIERMLGAYSELRNLPGKKYEDLDFVISGKIVPGYEYILEKYTKDQRGTYITEGVGRVNYIGRAPDSDLSALYSGARFFSFVSEEEGFGLPILEAMKCGCCVLTSNITANSEVAGEAAHKVDPFSVQSIKEGMWALLEDDSLCKSLIQKGYENIKKYSWEEAALDFMVVFQNLKQTGDKIGEKTSKSGRGSKSSKSSKTKYLKNILGVKVNFGLTKDSFLKLLQDKLENKTKSKKDLKNNKFVQNNTNYVCTINAEFVLKAQKDEIFRQILNKSFLSIPDGVGVLMADEYLNKVEEIKRKNFFHIRLFFKGIKVGLKSVFKNNYLGQRLAGSQLIYDMCEIAEQNGYSVYFLGGWEKNKWGQMKPKSGQIARKTSSILRKMYPKLRVVGATSDFSHSEEDDGFSIAKIREDMRKSKVNEIDMIFVAYGAGGQEKWMDRNLHKLPAKLGIGLGGTFDMIVGTQKKCPKLLINLGLESLFRLVTQPWRLKRVIKATVIFPIRVYFSTFKQE